MDITHEDLVILVSHLAEVGFTGKEIAAVVEKPWDWADELAEARALLEAAA